MLFERLAKLKVSLLSDLALLTPSYTQSNSEVALGDQPRTDTIVEGHITLSLPTARKVPGINVQLVNAVAQ